MAVALDADRFAIFKDLLEVKFFPVANQFLTSRAHTRAIFSGNQSGKTTIAMSDLVMRLLKIHPNPDRNRINHPIRLVSKVVPQGDSDEENPQYVEIKRRLPSVFIKKDVTARSKFMTVRDPLGGADMKLEFMAKTQDLDAFMGVQRSAHYQDEEIDRIKWDESMMRLLRDGGDSVVTLTPVKGLDWMFDAVWKRSSRIYRSRAICDRFGYPVVEHGEEDSGIESFCWATDDNPVMDQASIDRIFEGIDDPDELAMRRYGVFRQVSGRIYKSFDKLIHVIPAAKIFDPAMFRKYWHYRIIDYHPAKKWYISWVAVTPTHEWFVWRELLGNHDNKTTYLLRDEIKEMWCELLGRRPLNTSEDPHDVGVGSDSEAFEDAELNRCTLIDPLANMKQPNTGFTVFEDLSRGEHGLRRLASADTKNTNGRENIKTRLKNSLICQVPGNNLVRSAKTDPRYGDRLPTLWFLDTCPVHIQHFNSWRYVDWQQEHVKAIKETKRESEKYSDMCRNLEFLGCLNPVFYETKKTPWEGQKLFQGRR